MNVLHLYAGNLFGGIETLLVTLATHRHLCPALNPHFGLCFEGRLADELRRADVPVHIVGPVRLRKPWTIALARRRLARLLRSRKYDLAICHSAWSQAIFGPLVRARRMPLVFWLHNATAGRHWLERWARTTLPELVLCNSHFTASMVGNLYPHALAEVLYCPVPPAPLSITPQEGMRMRAQCATSTSAVVLIQVSRSEPGKGHGLHMEALHRLADLPGWICWFVGGSQRPGEARYEAAVQRQAAQLGIGPRCRFLGERPDIPRLLAAADICCQPNTGPEAFGLALVEGLQAGLPVVTTAIGGPQEIVDATCGIVVPPGDSSALAAALHRLITDRAWRIRLGATGPRRAMNLCNPAKQLQRLHDHLTDVIERPQAGRRGRGVSGDSECQVS